MHTSNIELCDQISVNVFVISSSEPLNPILVYCMLIIAGDGDAHRGFFPPFLLFTFLEIFFSLKSNPGYTLKAILHIFQCLAAPIQPPVEPH
jgi:hypothetical protein